jgi:hypothetical protein
VDVTLPATLRHAVRIEFRRAFHAPYEAPIVVVVNGVLMLVLWFFLPVHWKNALFSLHGTLAFSMVLAGWMFSDVPATNVLGPDARRVIAALGDPTLFRRLLYAKNIVLWTIVAPLCSVVAIVIGVNAHDLTATVISIVAIAVVPFGALGFSAWVGIRFPYHPIPLAERWEHRRPWGHMIVRWLSLAVTPYILVPVILAVLMLPSLAFWSLFAEDGLKSKLSNGEYALGILIACVLAVAGSLGGHRLGERLARHRRAELSQYLSDSSRGWPRQPRSRAVGAPLACTWQGNSAFVGACSSVPAAHGETPRSTIETLKTAERNEATWPAAGMEGRSRRSETRPRLRSRPRLASRRPG